MDFARGNTPLMFSFSLLSILSVIPMIVSFIIFSHMRKKEYMRIVLYLAISNLFNNLGSLPGEPINGSFACWFQGIVTNIFTVASVFWSVVITYMIHRIVFTGKIPTISWKIHALCWGIPTAVTFLPFINVTYGAPDGIGWCWVVPKPSTPSWAILFWYWESFYFWLVVGVSVMLVMCAHIVSHIKSFHESTQEKLMKVVNSVRYYPVIIAVCWGGQLVYDFSTESDDFPGADSLHAFALTISCAQGFFTAILFFISNGDIRKCWYQLLTIGSYINPDEIRRRNSISPSQTAVRSKAISFAVDTGSSAKIHVTDFRVPQSDAAVATNTADGVANFESAVGGNEDCADEPALSLESQEKKSAVEPLAVKATENSVISFDEDLAVGTYSSSEHSSDVRMMHKISLPLAGRSEPSSVTDEKYIIQDA